MIALRSRLRLVGLLTLLAGVASFGLAALQLSLPWLLPRLDLEIEIDTMRALAGAITYGAIGVTLMACGWGAFKLRRWGRPVMLTIGWVWLLAGAVTVAYVVLELDDLILLATNELETLEPWMERFVAAAILIPTFIFGLLPPLLIFWAWRDESAAALCHQEHPQPDWSDRCPTSVVVLALASGYTGLLSFPLAIRPTVPWFHTILTGNGGRVVTIMTGIALLAIGWSLFQRKRAALWATGLLTTLLGVATALALWRVPRADWYRALDYPPRLIEEITAQAPGPPMGTISLVIVVTLATWWVLWKLREQFD